MWIKNSLILGLFLIACTNQQSPVADRRTSSAKEENLKSGPAPASSGPTCTQGKILTFDAQNPDSLPRCE